MARIGFIGLGNMGGPMVLNLVKAGHTVRAFDLNPTALDAAVAGGAIKASGVAEAVSDAEFVVTMLPAGEHVRAVWTGADGIIDSLRGRNQGPLLIDASTIDVATARAVTKAAEAMEQAAKYAAGRKVSVVLDREGKSIELSLELAEGY